MALTNTGIYTGTGVFNLTANSATTGNIGSISANGLTTGNALAISSTSTAGGASGASYLLNLSRSGTNSNATHTSYGIASSVTNTGTTSVNVGGLFTANGATTNRGIEVAAMTGATSTGLTIGALSGTTANTGINIGAISGIGASGTGITVGNISTTGTNNYGLLLGSLTGGTSNNQQIATGAITATGSVINAQLNLGGVSGTANNSVNYGVLVGNISAAGTLTTNVGVSLGTLTGGTAANYQINTGVLTSATTTTNAQINLGGVVTTGGTTNYGINIGALSGTGTTNTALNITAATSTGTTTGIAVGALSGAGTTNTGISVGAVSGATTNNALTTAGGAVSFTDASNTVASLSLTNNTATTFGNGGNTAGVIDLQSTTLSTGNFMNIEVNGLTTGTGFNLSSSGTIASGGELMSLQATGITTGRILDISSAANTLTSGQLVSIVTSSSALTGSTTTGSLLQTSYTGTNGSTFVGNLNYFNYSPASTPSTSPTGDLMRLHLGANATNFAGNLFNLVDDTTSIFSVSKTAFTTSLPSNFTAAGDVAIAYDLNFTNPTASYIKSAAPLAIVAGETFNSSNLTLQTYNQGTIVLDTANTTTTAVDLTNSNLTTGTGFNVSLNALTTGTGVSINSSSTAATSGTLLSVAQTGATTGITGAVAALSTTASTNSSARLLTLTANSMTVGKILTISGTGITSGQALQIDGSTTVGVTGNFVNIATDVGSAGSLMNLAPDFSGSAVTGVGLKLTATDATANANNDRAIQSALTMTGNAAKTGYSIYSDISSSSTTADTLSGVFSTTGVTGIMTTGTRSVYGVSSQPTAGAESTGGTTNVYGVYSQVSADVGAGGAVNAYGLYVANGTYDTDGTSTAYGLYIAAISGADSNYGAYISSGVAIGDQASTSYGFEVYKSTATYAASISNVGNTTSANGLNIRAGTTTAGTLIDFRSNNNTPVGAITITGATTSNYGTSSDRRLKENIVDTHYGLKDLMKVQVRDYNFIADGASVVKTGFIAQDLYNIYPEPVSPPTSDDRYWMVDYGKMTPLIVKSLQELNYKVENALLTINPDGTSNTNLNIQKITVSGDAKIGGLVSASNFALDANLLNRSGAMASVPVSGNKVSLADSVNALNNQTTANTNALSQLELEQASQSAELAQARILGEQAVNHAETLDEKVASTSANLSSLSSRIDDLLASLSGESTDSATTNDEPITTNDLTPPTQLIATDSATFAFDPSVTSVTLDTLVASESLKSLGETFLGQTTIAGDLSVDGTLSFTNGDSINAFPTLFFQNNPLAQAVDFFNGKITLDAEGTFAAESLALGDQSLGTATIAAGQTEITIPSSLITPNSKIFLTPESAIAGNIYVGQKVAGSGFKVKLSQPNAAPVKFNWMIVQTKEAGI